MVSLTLVAVGFLVATAVVMALARGSTARWERDRRAARERGDAPARPATSAGSALAGLRGHVSRFPAVKVLTRFLAKRRTEGTARVRPMHWLGGAPARRLLRLPVPRAPRRALALLHRHEDHGDPRVPIADRDESPAP